MTPNKTWNVAYESYEILTADPPYGVTGCPDQAVFAFTNTRGIKYDIIPDGSFQVTSGGTTYNTVLSGLSQSACSGHTMEVRYHFKTGSSWSSPTDKQGVYRWVAGAVFTTVDRRLRKPLRRICVSGLWGEATTEASRGGRMPWQTAEAPSRADAHARREETG